MNPLMTFQVFPNMPEPLAFLETLSRNLWWSWKKEAEELFRRINPHLWEESERNPIVFFSKVPFSRLEELAVEESFLAHLQQVKRYFEKRVVDPVIQRDLPFHGNETVAYFSMEFGLHESIPLFAGGLGILAGDYLKSASNMALPLTGIGLLYGEGYFKQFLDPSGWQQEEYPKTDIYNLPIQRVKDGEGNNLTISAPGPEGDIFADVWKLLVGRIPLYLLDADIPENTALNRKTTSRLYSGTQKNRLAQEALLGIGGVRALSAMGIHPKVCHMNEGHSAFSGLERLAQMMSLNKIDLPTALEIVPRATVFTTHTPVAAGHDEFPLELVRPMLKSFEEPLGVGVEEIIKLGQANGAASDATFSMFILGKNLAQYCNAVSELHGETARRMWSHLWPDRLEDETPISHVTNGIHVSTFISDEFADLFDRYLGPEWYMSSRKPENITRIDDIYDEELWQAHERNRTRLVRTCRDMFVKQYRRRYAPREMIETAKSVLDSEVLTIGFARRFAEYKRANLLFMDPERLEALVNDKTRPIQFIFAGKAHPMDNVGKELIKNLVQFIRRPNIRSKIIFLEDYDMHLSKHLVQGVDVWLNTPRRPNEACGTSGMKAAVNGVLNVSILDGWWCEGYSEEVGWAIGKGEVYADSAYQDAVESQALYNVLENEVIPCFYDRKGGDVPFDWVEKMKASMKMAMEHFCGLRMVADYNKRFYIPAAKRLEALLAANAKEASHIAFQMNRLRQYWGQIRISDLSPDRNGPFRVGETFNVEVTVCLGEIKPNEVVVELYYGLLESADVLKSYRLEKMWVKDQTGQGQYLYGCNLICRKSGRYGFTARVLPDGDERMQTTPKLVTWV